MNTEIKKAVELIKSHIATQRKEIAELLGVLKELDPSQRLNDLLSIQKGDRLKLIVRSSGIGSNTLKNGDIMKVTGVYGHYLDTRYNSIERKTEIRCSCRHMNRISFYVRCTAFKESFIEDNYKVTNDFDYWLTNRETESLLYFELKGGNFEILPK